MQRLGGQGAGAPASGGRGSNSGRKKRRARGGGAAAGGGGDDSDEAMGGGSGGGGSGGAGGQLIQYTPASEFDALLRGMAAVLQQPGGGGGGSGFDFSGAMSGLHLHQVCGYAVAASDPSCVCQVPSLLFLLLSRALLPAARHQTLRS